MLGVLPGLLPPFFLEVYSMSSGLVGRLALTVVVVLGAAIGAATTARAASIVGDTVDIYGVAQSNGGEFLHDTVVVVDPGIEFSQIILIDPIYNLDIGPSSISLESLADWYSPWFNSGFPATTLEIRDIDVPGMPNLVIGGVSVIFSDTIVPEQNAPLNYPAFSAANVSFTDHSVILQTGPYSFPTGSRVLIDIVFVPEPGTISLLACGAFGAVLLVRRKRRAA